MTTDQPDPWLRAQEQLSRFTLHRCVTMKHEDWRELSAVLSSVNNLYSGRSSGPPVFVYTLELLLKLGQVTSCLLSLNGDDPAFSVARVAQAIKTTTCVLESCHRLSQGAGLSPDIADSLARQRCEQTPLLHAMAWALRQEARALFFNPRPTALSLATALLDLFRAIQRIWPDDIFAPPHEAAAAAAHSATAGDPSAARLADPAAQLAMAMMRCAGRAMGEVGAASSKQIMLSGLRVADDLMHQISSVIFRAEMPGEQPQVKQLLQSPSILQLMLTMLAIQTQRLQQQLGMKEEDSFTFQHSVKHNIVLPDSDGDLSSDSLSGGSFSSITAAAAAQDAAAAGSAAVGGSPQQQQQQHIEGDSDDDEHDGHAGYGDLHQLWNQVLGMAKKQAAIEQPEQQEKVPATPLLQFWKALGLPESMLALAATSDVFTRPPDVEYVQACKVARFLLQGSSHLQPSKDRPTGSAAAETATAALDLAGHTAAGQRRDRDLSPMFPRSPMNAAGLSIDDGAELRGREGAISPSAATAALLVDSCRDYGLKGQEELEVLSLQRLLPVVLLDTAVSLTSGQFACPLAAAYAAVQHAAAAAKMHANGSNGSLCLGAKLHDSGSSGSLAGGGKMDGSGCTSNLTGGSKMHGSGSSSNLARGSRLHGSGSSLARLSCGSCSTPSMLEMVVAACAAAAYSARCWPVLQKVAAVQEPSFSLGGAPSGVFSGLSMVYWRQYELENPEMHLPVQEVLQLVVQVIQQLFGQCSQQLQQPPLLLGAKSTQQHLEGAGAAVLATLEAADKQQQPDQHSIESVVCKAPANGVAKAAAADGPLAAGVGEPAAVDAAAVVLKSSSGATEAKQALPEAAAATAGSTAAAAADTAGILGTAIIPSRPPLSPRSREALWGLLEVLTAVSKLPWDVEPAASHKVHHKHSSSLAAAVSRGPASRAGRTLKQQQLDRLYTGEAWRATSQAVAAAVEAVLRSCSGTSAVIPAAPKHGAGSTENLLLASAGLVSGRERHQMLHPATVALGSCLASMCAPLGQPGPLVAAVGAAEPGSAAQLQLFALLASKIKLMLTDTSGRKELIAMHPIEQTPVYILDQVSKRLYESGSAVEGSADMAKVAAAAVPWLLILARLIKHRGRLLGEVLQRDREASAPGHSHVDRSATASLHNAFWQIQMATASALALEKHLGFMSGVRSSAVGSILAEEAEQLVQQPGQQAIQPPGQQAVQHTTTVGGFDLQHVRQQLEQEIMPALKHAVQLCKAAMKLARHYHETGFASGFSAGFAAGYAAAIAAGAGAGAALGGGSISFASPAGVLQQACIRNLPQQLKVFGGVLSGQLLLPFWCNNPHCLNMSKSSELLLLSDGVSGAGSSAVVCGKCGAARYCSDGCRAQHKMRHKPLCRQLCKRMEAPMWHVT